MNFKKIFKNPYLEVDHKKTRLNSAMKIIMRKVSKPYFVMSKNGI